MGTRERRRRRHWSFWRRRHPGPILTGAHWYLKKAPQWLLVVLAPQASGPWLGAHGYLKGAAGAILSFWRRRHPVPLLIDLPLLNLKQDFYFPLIYDENQRKKLYKSCLDSENRDSKRNPGKVVTDCMQRGPPDSAKNVAVDFRFLPSSFILTCNESLENPCVCFLG